MAVSGVTVLPAGLNSNCRFCLALAELASTSSVFVDMVNGSDEGPVQLVQGHYPACANEQWMVQLSRTMRVLSAATPAPMFGSREPSDIRPRYGAPAAFMAARLLPSRPLMLVYARELPATAERKPESPAVESLRNRMLRGISARRAPAMAG